MVTVSKLLLPQVLIARRVDRQVQEVILLRNFNVKTLHIEFREYFEHLVVTAAQLLKCQSSLNF